MVPVSGAIVQLYAVGTGGNGSQATSLLSNPVSTDSDGQFDIVGDYACASPNQQVYIVALGGNPGLSSSVDNQALVMVSAVGNCSNLAANTVEVNELTTVAAAYALAPFMTSYDHVGASATNTAGIANAFLNAQLLVSTVTGTAATLPSNLAIEQGKLYALGNALAPCVASDGTTACGALFTAATPNGGSAPADTLSAVLNIVKNPGNNVPGVFNAISTPAPYPKTMTQAPNDWTMSLTVTGGGAYEPTGLAIDKFGNVWVTNYGGPAPNGGNNPVGVIAYSPQGTPFSGTPFGSSAQTEAYGLAIDTNGDVWVTSEENISNGSTSGSVAKFTGAETSTPGTLVNTYSDASLNFPESIAADTSNNTILIGNYAGGSATVYDLNGNFIKNVGSGYSSFPVGIASDGAGGLWLANYNSTNITHVLANGTAENTTCCNSAEAVATDPQGNVWVTNAALDSGEYTFSEVSNAGVVLLNQQSGGGISTPGGAAVDAGGQFWVVNYYDGSLSEIAGNAAGVPAGTPLTPFALGKDAHLLEPFAIAPDASGNLWVSNRAMSDIVMFFGLATPTATPAAPLPTAP